MADSGIGWSPKTSKEVIKALTLIEDMLAEVFEAFEFEFSEKSKFSAYLGFFNHEVSGGNPKTCVSSMNSLQQIGSSSSRP